ncbi:DUF2339 domain-containing protein [Zobellia amurskyensis]|uniref:DUF2339 domain-containing protein n=1 Tax=Zobellia amurskyensis TaxID=248905 RepID=A0A7X3D1W2_9FLAO|nr:DUF2339 domain-containing protein [Zobellia amurskyensis]MUH36604.1 DUF2339 domain-containing protein [Zobellia amurskyensis]
MSNHQDRIDQLNQKLELLLSKQEGFAKELMSLYQEIEALKKLRPDQLAVEQTIPEPVPEINTVTEPLEPEQHIIQETAEPVTETPIIQPVASNKIKQPKGKSNLEKFIGENLINKIGIAITVIGVAIGAKYSIENELISPLTRIILGYLSGLGLLGFGIKLKSKYENYSAVLVSGALAILYFITFAAYSFYGLFPQLMAFALMLVFTIFGVVAALNYNKQVIAHIGLVGAYAVPFLLSNNSGSVATLFAYMAIINVGILVISLKKYWKPLFYSAFVFTYLIYSSWMIFSYKIAEHFSLAFIYLAVFFVVFYATFLAYKVIKKEKFLKSDVVLLLLNSFIFYGLGYSLLSNHETGKDLLGVFTLVNAFIHFLVSAVLFKKKLADRNLFHLISGLVLVFITIAVPVQLDGNWVTLLWTLQAALLFYIGRAKSVSFYEYLSYPLMLLALLSLTQDWGTGYSNYFSETEITPIFNSYFLTSVLFLVAFGFINWINQKHRVASDEKPAPKLPLAMSFVIPIILLFVSYMSFFLEIEQYWNSIFSASEIDLKPNEEYGHSIYNYDLKDFGSIWLFIYSFLFLTILAFANIKKIKNRILGLSTLVTGVAASLFFLTAGLYILSELRESYIDRALSEYYEIGVMNIALRYVSFAFFGLLWVALIKLSKSAFMKINLKIPIEIVTHISFLWILSSELLNWMDLAGSDQSYKLGLSILWGIYALFLIILGIYKQRKYLRIGAIALFGVTLAKLFFYDIASLNTIAKTIVFVSLGVLLLIISFLYNKYKNVISDEPEK